MFVFELMNAQLTENIEGSMYQLIKNEVKVKI
jgi:hypothetical protein